MAEDRKLTVLQLLPALESGGVERGTLEVAGALVQHGHRALVISAGGRQVEGLLAGGAEHFVWPIGRKSLKTLGLVYRLRRFLVEQRVDILHARSRIPAWIAWLAWRGMNPATRPRFVTTVHGLYGVSRYSAIMTRGEAVIAVSDTVRDYVLREYPATLPWHIHVIHRGVEAREYPYGWKPDANWQQAFFAQYPQACGKQLLVLPGRITRLKGHEDFIELIARLRRRGLPVHGLIVGGATPSKQRYLQKLRYRIRAQGVQNDVTLTGQREDLKNILAISQLVLSLSQQPESFGRTTLEALRLGIPTAGYAHGGVGEILKAIYPAGLLPMGQIDATFQRLLPLLQQPETVPEGDFYPLQHMLDATRALYEQLARTPRH